MPELHLECTDPELVASIQRDMDWVVAVSKNVVARIVGEAGSCGATDVQQNRQNILPTSGNITLKFTKHRDLLGLK